MSARFWGALDTLAHRVKLPRRRWICDRYDLALGCTKAELRRTAPMGADEAETFYEDDEPAEKIIAVFKRGPRFVTGRPDA